MLIENIIRNKVIRRCILKNHCGKIKNKYYDKKEDKFKFAFVYTRTHVHMYMSICVYINVYVYM